MKIFLVILWIVAITYLSATALANSGKKVGQIKWPNLFEIYRGLVKRQLYFDQTKTCREKGEEFLSAGPYYFLLKGRYQTSFTLENEGGENAFLVFDVVSRGGKVLEQSEIFEISPGTHTKTFGAEIPTLFDEEFRLRLLKDLEAAVCITQKEIRSLDRHLWKSWEWQ